MPVRATGGGGRLPVVAESVDMREFQVMAKPVGALCNMACRYCYYLGKKELYPRAESFRMSDDLLDDYIHQHLLASRMDPVMFAWHGGEPTLLGIEYFRRIVEIQTKYRTGRRQIVNCIQTNGMLIDEAWCRFFSANRFHVGLSMDGPRELHDASRITTSGDPTHKQVLHAFTLLKRHRVSFDILCVVHAGNVRRPGAVYRFFRDIGVEFLQFLPLVRPDAASAPGDSVPAAAYGEFLCSIFDEWLERDVGRLVVQNFEEAALAARGLGHALCVFRETCGDVIVVEHNGDAYCCDHFVTPSNCLGNIRQTPLSRLLESQQLHAFGLRKRDGLPKACRDCEVLPFCNGGCPKDRILLTETGEAGLNYLCDGLKKFFLHSTPRLRRLAAGSRAAAPSDEGAAPRSPSGQAELRVGRNEPCPCGSGLKYKKCCLKRAAFGAN
jgi:uncharacterized protein